MVIFTQLCDFSIDSSEIFVHFFHLLGLGLAAGPIVVMEAVSSTSKQNLKAILHFPALPEVVTQEPMRLFLYGDGDKVEKQEEKSNIE